MRHIFRNHDDAQAILVILLIFLLPGCFPDINLRDEIDAGSAGSTSEDGAAGINGPNEQGTIENPTPDPSDKTPPTIALPAGGCLDHEVPQASFCVGVASYGVSIRFGTNEPAKAKASTDTGSLFEESAYGTSHWIPLGPLTPATGQAISVEAADASGNAARASLDATTDAARPALAITEVLVDPKGPEPAQEFIEVYNFGQETVDLAGWMIDDNGDQNGDLLPAASLSSGQVGVLVPDSYDESSAEDPTPASEALVIRVTGSLCSSGLRNDTGETVELYDPAGALVSLFPNTLGKPAEGRSAERLNPFAPDQDPFNWQWNPDGSSTPGKVPWGS